MISRTVAAGLLAGATFTAVASGSYLAVRSNHADTEAPAAVIPQGEPSATPAGAVQIETEAVVIPPADEAHESTAPELPAAASESTSTAAPSEPARTSSPRARRPSPPFTPPAPAAPAPEPATAIETARPVATATAPPASVTPAPSPEPVPALETPVNEPPARVEEPEPVVIEEVVVPASAVIGLEIEQTVSTEQAQIEDRVNARVTRDVYANGQLAIPAGARAIGNVTVVERGGKVKDRARLGVSFQTLVLADGRQVPMRTETIYREGDSPGGESSRKIGGAAIGGAVLGAILGGGKGAMAGAAAGAAGGTAVVMAGGRNAATLASGSEVTVRLSAPVTIETRR